MKASNNNHKKYFTFESQQYYAAYETPGFDGLMIFTCGGVAVSEFLFPELWMYYRYQKDFFKVSVAAPLKAEPSPPIIQPLKD